MKILFSFLTLFLLTAAGCESAASDASNDEKSISTKNAEDTSSSQVSKSSSIDYTDKNEIGDISGDFTINGTITNGATVEGKLVRIYETEGKDIFILDSTIVKNGAFTLNLKDAKIGVHKIGFKKYQLGEFILNPNEKSINLSGNAFNIERTIKITNSEENKALTEHKSASNKHKAELKKIRRMKASTDVKLKLIYEQEKTLKVQQDVMAESYPNTFFAKMIRRMQSPNRFDQGNYWKDIDFSDESLVRSMALNDRIQDYMRIHASKDRENGFYNAADEIQDKASVNDKVKYFMLFTMMEGFYTSGMEDEAFYIADNYLNDNACSDSDVANIMKRRKQDLKSLKIGNTPADFTILDENGKSVNLRTVAAKNDLTLVMFWASWCHKCEQEMPVIKKIYDAHKAKGFEIIGVSVDMERNAWLNGIKAKQCNWINVSQLEGWQSDVARDYRIATTPVMFLLDSKGELLLKPDRAFKLEKWMNENFN